MREQVTTRATRLLTPYNAQTGTAEIVFGVNLSGRRAIVTGATSGIGIETARALASAGAEVTIAGRDPQAGERTIAEIVDSTGNSLIDFAQLDLADRVSVRSFIAGWHGPLHILVNNAGIMASPERRTPEGWELQFATNHLGHFALAMGLRHALADAGGARVVSVSSGGHLLSPVIFEDIHFRIRAYDPWLAYGQSKTANILFAIEANRRWRDERISVNALMPGAIRSNLQRHLNRGELDRMEARMNQSNDFEWKTPEQGAATSVMLAASPLLGSIGGRYFEDCNEAEPNRPGSRRGVAAYALDPETAEYLWQVSSDMLAL
jgi:NAD(P)-dependent dehydrogenase (short-subunit alcohol dehydrogenase family)